MKFLKGMTALLLTVLFSFPGTNYFQTTLSNFSFSGGGTVSGDGNYNINLTIGQPITGSGTNVMYSNNIGFWYQAADLITGVDEMLNGEIPLEYRLDQNYPNPFNPSTTIQFALIKESPVLMKLYDILGNEVKTIVNQEYKAGVHEVVFGGEGLSSGVYFYRIHAGEFVKTKRLVLLK